MTWTKLGDEFNDGTEDLTDAEFRTHVQALVWSNWRGLDLMVPKRHVRRFADSPSVEAAVEGLIVKGWWEDRGDAWWIGVHWPEWQEERDLTELRQAQRAERNRRYYHHRLGDHGLCDPQRCKQATVDNQTGLKTGLKTYTRPDPSRPVQGSGRSPDPYMANGSTAPLEGGAAAYEAEQPPCPHGEPGGHLLAADGKPRCEVCRAPACGHGAPGGDLLIPGHGLAWCPMCRRGIPAENSNPAPTGGKR
jgi:hypothetical protein